MAMDVLLDRRLAANSLSATIRAINPATRSSPRRAAVVHSIASANRSGIKFDLRPAFFSAIGRLQLSGSSLRERGLGRQLGAGLKARASIFQTVGSFEH